MRTPHKAGLAAALLGSMLHGALAQEDPGQPGPGEYAAILAALPQEQAAAMREMLQMRAEADGTPYDPDAQIPFSVQRADLNGDGRADLLVTYSYEAGYCGTAGCATAILLAAGDGYAHQLIGLPYHHETRVLDTSTGGMRDLLLDGGALWKWNGTGYDLAGRR